MPSFDSLLRSYLYAFDNLLGPDGRADVFLRHGLSLDPSPSGRLNPEDLSRLAWAYGVGVESRANKPKAQAISDGAYTIPFTYPNGSFNIAEKERFLARFIQSGKPWSGIGDFAARALYYGLNRGVHSNIAAFHRTLRPIQRDGMSGPLEITEVSPVTLDPVERVLMVIHGYRQRASVDFAPWAAKYVYNKGYPVLMGHLPGHGDSLQIEGKPVYANHPEQYTGSVKEFFDYARHAYPEAQVDVLAHSMGAAVFLNAVLDGSLEDHAQRLGQVVLSAPMLALSGLGGILSEHYPHVLSRAGMGLAGLFRNNKIREYRPKGLKDSVDDELGQERVFVNRALGISGHLDARLGDWLHVAFQMMDRVKKSDEDEFGQRGLDPARLTAFISSGDKKVHGAKSEGILRRVLPRAKVRVLEAAPHRLPESKRFGGEIMDVFPGSFGLSSQVSALLRPV